MGHIPDSLAGIIITQIETVKFISKIVIFIPQFTPYFDFDITSAAAKRNLA